MLGIILVALLFIVCGVLFMCGKGGFLIAGYNTMPKKDKENIDKKALCRFMGWLMFYMAFAVLFDVADYYFPGRQLDEYPPYLVFAGVIFAIIYANTGNRFLKKGKK